MNSLQYRLRTSQGIVQIARVVFILTLLCFGLVAVCQALNIPNRPTNYVTDLAGIVDNRVEQKLNLLLAELQQRTTAQVAVLTIKSLEGQAIDDVSITVAHDKWKLGQKGKDNGVLLLVAFKDRRYRIEVGYGLEGIVPDSLAGSIGRKVLAPYFKKGDYSTGIYAAALAIANEIAIDTGVKLTGMPKLQRSLYRTAPRKPPSFLSRVIGVVLVIILFIAFIRNPRLFLVFLLFSSMGGRHGGWGGGGGFGGGGFSGGGGGFGGGGASGGW